MEEAVSTRTSLWLQVVSHLSPEFGGIATSVPRLAAATELASSHACPVAGFCDPEELLSVSNEQRQRTQVFSPDRMRWTFDRTMRRETKALVSSANGVHIHGLWETHCMVAATLARESKLPYIISAHGMLEQWALRNKRLKKALYAALVEIRRLQRAACLRALSQDEAGDYRRLGLRNTIAIIPNGTDAPPAVSSKLFREQHPELDGKQIVLFLGRLHHKKGIHLLLEAWSKAVSKHGDMHLILAGPGTAELRADLDLQIENLKLKQQVTFTGMLLGDLKWSALASASLFVLPSYSEGFSMAILEALSMGVPVIATTACHIPEVETRKCGWIVPPSADAISKALADFVLLSPGDAYSMGQNAIQLVASRFSSSIVGAQLADLYSWQQGGSKPSSFEIC